MPPLSPPPAPSKRRVCARGLACTSRTLSSDIIDIDIVQPSRRLLNLERRVSRLRLLRVEPSAHHCAE